MADKFSEIASFYFGIRMIRNEDGSVDWETSFINKGILAEVVLAKVEAFLRNQKDNYFSDYKNSMTDFRE